MIPIGGEKTAHRFKVTGGRRHPEFLLGVAEAKELRQERPLLLDLLDGDPARLLGLARNLFDLGTDDVHAHSPAGDFGNFLGTHSARR